MAMATFYVDADAAPVVEELEYEPSLCPACECSCGEACGCEEDGCGDCGCGVHEHCGDYWVEGGTCCDCGAENESVYRSVDTSRTFSVRRPSVVRSADEVQSNDEFSVAREMGLDRELPLPMACADFYILERLFEDLHDRSYQYDAASGQTRLNGQRFPAEFGSDSRLERLAYSVAATREQLNTELSRQLLLYMVMATGGELRHASSGKAFKRKKQKATPKSQWPKNPNGKRVIWREFKMYEPYVQREKDGTLGPNRKAELRNYGCYACWEMQQNHPHLSVIEPCWNLKPASHANPKCGYFKAWAEKRGIVTSTYVDHEYKPHTGRLKRYFAMNPYGNGRGLAWREWARMYEEEGAPLLKDCAEVFTKWMWVDGYGGKKWGEATEFAHLFANGKMTASAFLDRVWTLEHNGGNLFNKYYTVNTNQLRTVLETQAADDQVYTNLRKHASRYTRELLSEYEALKAYAREQRCLAWA